MKEGVIVILCFLGFVFFLIWATGQRYDSNERDCQKFGSSWHANKYVSTKVPQCVNDNGEAKWLN